jgi:hypothetical protein
LGDRVALCVVFMPMLLGYEGIRAAVRQAVELSGAAMRRLEDLLPDPEWQLWVTREIETADLVVADVTDNNAFVMYELGVAHAHRTPTLLIMNRRNGSIPATVKGSYFISYDDDALAEFVPRLAGAIRHTQRFCWNPEPVVPACEIYTRGLTLLEDVWQQTGTELQAVSVSEFATFIDVARQRGEIPALDGDWGYVSGVLLARLVLGSDSCQVMDVIERYVNICNENIL